MPRNHKAPKHRFQSSDSDGTPPGRAAAYSEDSEDGYDKMLISEIQHEALKGQETFERQEALEGDICLRDAIGRASLVDPAGGRCLIENCDASRGVDYIHCVPRYLRENSKLVRPQVCCHLGCPSHNFRIAYATRVALGSEILYT
jgi:hypothetical protein